MKLENKQMVEITMTKDAEGSEDGFTIKQFTKGSDYTVSSWLANVFIKEMKVAKAKEVKAPEMTEEEIAEAEAAEEERIAAEEAASENLSEAEQEVYDSMTAKEIIEKLDDLEVDFDPKQNKRPLWEILKTNVPDLLG